MSAFGGDSWAREAQYRKRRVDDLMLSSSSSSSSFKKLSNGKYACLICSHNPVLDSPLALSMHTKGSGHVAAESRLMERELSRKEELNKRIALSSSNSTTDSKSSNSIDSGECIKRSKIQNQPLIEQTRRAILEAQSIRSWEKNGSKASSTCSNNISEASKYRRFEEAVQSRETGSVNPTETTAGKMLAEWNEELHKRREKELKFIAAGWKRDGFGKWFKDENVEFDSDEEDPNECLN